MTGRRGYVPDSYDRRQRVRAAAFREERRDGRDAWPPRKEEAPCCLSRRDEDGRLPIGFCGPGCLRRRRIWRSALRAAAERRVPKPT